MDSIEEGLLLLLLLFISYLICAKAIGLAPHQYEIYFKNGLDGQKLYYIYFIYSHLLTLLPPSFCLWLTPES